MINSANLWKLKKDVQLKSKVYYEYDKQKQRYSNSTSILLPNEVINYNENQNNNILPQNLYADFILFKNKSDYYLNDKLSFEYEKRNENASLIANDLKRFQNYQLTSSSFSNELDLIKSPKGKTIKQYYSYISFQTHPEDLNIDSARYPSIFLNNDVLRNIIQNVSIPSFFTNNYLSLQNGKDNFSQSYKLGFSTNIQKFNSDLTAQNQSGETVYPDSSSNNLVWKEYKLYVEPNYEWKKGDFRIIAKLPVKYQFISSDENRYSLKIDDKRLIMNQNFSVRYHKENGFSGSMYYLKTTSAGNILQSYPGLVLNDYRSVTQNEEIFGISKNLNFGTFLSYKNPIKIFFINVVAYYQENLSNNIAYGNINQNLSFTERRLLDNTASFYNINTDVSKYFFNLRSSATLSYAYQSGLRKQFLNNQLYAFESISQSLGFKWNGRIGEKVRYDYNITNQSYSSQPKQIFNGLKAFEVKNTIQKISLEYDIMDNFFIKTNSSFLNNKNNSGLDANTLFIDFSLRYKLIKKKIDFSLDLRNLANVKNYEVSVTNLNIQNSYSYPLQGRMGIFKVQFTY